MFFRESFCESGEGVRLPRERGRPPGKFRNFRGSSGNFRGSLGNFRGTSGLLLSSTVRDLPGKSPKTSGGVRGTSGEVRGLPRSSGNPDPLPATRQICLQVLEASKWASTKTLFLNHYYRLQGSAAYCSSQKSFFQKNFGFWIN